MRLRPFAIAFPLALLLAGGALAQADAEARSVAATATAAANPDAGPAPPPADGVSYLIAPADPADGAWVEVTPLAGAAAARRWSMVAPAPDETVAVPRVDASGGDAPGADDPESEAAPPPAEPGDVTEPAAAPWPELRPGEPLDPGLPRGPAMVCTGAPDFAVGCRRVFLNRPGPAISRGPAAEALAVELELDPGFAVIGAYRMDG
ncbi:MAG: hypothetical protein AAFY88_22930, partial [Acidobacteriota bacterium]